MIDWLSCEEQLPPCDGHYLITNNPKDPFSPIGIALYDGYGFLYDKIYRNPKYWAFYEECKKKYGRTNA